MSAEPDRGASPADVTEPAAVTEPETVTDSEAVENTRVVKDTEAVENTRVVKDTEAVENTRVVKDTRAVEDTGAVEDTEAKGAVSAPGPDGPKKTTRRFPLLTRDTARPEGGGRAAGGDAPAPARQWPLLTVLSTVGLGLLLTAFDVFRVGTILIGLALIAGAVMRWALPGVGMLAVRSRFTDMVTYGALGLAIVLLAMMAQPGPWLEIPFLSDTLHRTITT